eukprot:scaffold874_cov126-Cylindrotheca_fusiformis.AAC.20
MKLLTSISLLLVAAIPGAASEDCLYSIELNKESYRPYEEIEVSLQQCEPDPEDFVTIYDAAVGPVDGNIKHMMWMRACGSRTCSDLKDSAKFAFGPENNEHTWPLPVGEYRVALVKKDKKKGFAVQAESHSFKVEETDSKMMQQNTIRLG